MQLSFIALFKIMKNQSIRNIIKTYPSLFLYSIVILFLSIGVIATTGTKYVGMISIVLFSFIGAYWFFKKYLKIKLQFENPLKMKHLTTLFFVFCLVVFSWDILEYGGFPVVGAKDISTVRELTELRGQIHAGTNKLLIYLFAWNIRAFMPFALVLFYITNRKWFFYTILTISCVYAFVMMQKSYILSILVPLLCILIIRRKYIFAGFLIFIAGATIYSLIAITAHITDTDAAYTGKTVTIDETFTSKLYRYTIGISNRIFVVPGEMVAGWFDAIPDKKPFLMGDGYKIVAKIKGNEYHNYSTELYPIIRPHYHERGLTGSVNVATFMREYSNFGVLGLILSSIFMGFFFVTIENLFGQQQEFYWAINLFPIFLLTSGSILTILFSGGWLMLILLYFVFKKELTTAQKV